MCGLCWGCHGGPPVRVHCAVLPWPCALQAPNSSASQVWYDDPASLALKYATAAHLGLRGVGMWHLDALDYRCADAACSSERAAMWAALRAFTAPPALGGSGGGLAVA